MLRASCSSRSGIVADTAVTAMARSPSSPCATFRTKELSMPPEKATTTEPMSRMICCMVCCFASSVGWSRIGKPDIGLCNELRLRLLFDLRLRDGAYHHERIMLGIEILLGNAQDVVFCNFLDRLRVLGEVVQSQIVKLHLRQHLRQFGARVDPQWKAAHDERLRVVELLVGDVTLAHAFQLLQDAGNRLVGGFGSG